MTPQMKLLLIVIFTILADVIAYLTLPKDLFEVVAIGTSVFIVDKLIERG